MVYFNGIWSDGDGGGSVLTTVDLHTCSGSSEDFEICLDLSTCIDVVYAVLILGLRKQLVIICDEWRVMI